MQPFITKYTTPSGQHVTNNHGNFPGECVSLAARFAQEIQGIPDADAVFYCPVSGGARDLYENPTQALLMYYERIPYGQPIQPNDYVVWGINRGSYGHVAMNIDGRQVFQQLGTPVFTPAAVASIGVLRPLGYLRLKGANMPTEADVKRVFSTYKIKSSDGTTNPSPTQLTYYTSHMWDVLLTDTLNYVQDNYTLRSQGVDYGFKLGFDRPATADELTYWTDNDPNVFLQSVYNTRTTGPSTIKATKLDKGYYEV